MNVNVLDLIDFTKVDNLLEGFNKSTGFVTAILDLQGNVLSKSGWRQICTEFHRVNPETSKKCTISDTVLATKLAEGERYHFYTCLNGLVDVAVPIVINGEHIANLFSGQFFFEEPDRSFFIKQAGQFGFEEQKYLKAFEDVPVVSKEKVKVVMDFLLNMTQIISEITYQKLELLQLNEALTKSEERSRSAMDNILEGCQIIGFDWRYIYLNRTAEIHNRKSNKELVGKRYLDVWPGIEGTEVFKLIEQTLETRGSSHFENEFVFEVGTTSWFDLSIQPVPEGVFILSIDITERKLAEGQLHASELKFRKLYEEGPFGMALLNPDFRFEHANPQFAAIMGYSEEELQKLTFPEITHPDDRNTDFEQVRKLITKEISVYKTEKRYIRKDGQILWGSVTVTSNYSSEGEFLYNLAVVEDITPRRQKDDKIKRLTERISTATRASQVGIWDWEVSNNNLTWDDQMYALYGVKKEEFTGAYDAWVNGLHPDDREFCQDETRLALIGEKDYNTEFRVVWPDGTVRYIGAKGDVFRNDQGDPVRMIGVNFDITTRILAVNALRESEHRFKQVAEDAQEWIWEFDKNGLYTYSSPVCQSLLGFSTDEIVGRKNFYDFFAPEKKEELQKTIFEIISRKASFKHFENPAVHKSGDLLILTKSGSPILDDHGDVIGYRGVDSDVTERTKMLEELVFAKEKAEESDKLKTAFINNISHEIRTPLNGILGFSQFLSEPELSMNQRQEYMTIIQKSSNRLMNTINDYMDMAMIVSGTLEVHQKDFSLVPFFDKFLESAADLCAEMNILLVPVIPEEPRELTIFSDHEIIDKILCILLDNALKFTKQGSISCGFSIGKEFLEFFVTDTGIGIAPDKRELIFDMFTQEDNSNTRGYEGSGLGLTIARNLVKMLGGSIHVTSEKGKGSTFSFTVPYSAVAVHELNPAESIVATADHGHIVVLIAEDEESNYSYMELIMKRVGCRYLHARNGDEAVEICRENPEINLVLMDIKMPVMNGLEAVKLIRKFRRDLPVIAITAYAQTGDEHRFLSAGFDAYLAKPVKKESIVSLIEKYSSTQAEV